MKSIKKKKSHMIPTLFGEGKQYVIVQPKQQNIMVKHEGIRYKFETANVELPYDVAEYFIKQGIVTRQEGEKE